MYRTTAAWTVPETFPSSNYRERWVGLSHSTKQPSRRSSFFVSQKEITVKHNRQPNLRAARYTHECAPLGLPPINDPGGKRVRALLRHITTLRSRVIPFARSSINCLRILHETFFVRWRHPSANYLISFFFLILRQIVLSPSLIIDKIILKIFIVEGEFFR